MAKELSFLYLLDEVGRARKFKGLAKVMGLKMRSNAALELITQGSFHYTTLLSDPAESP